MHRKEKEKLVRKEQGGERMLISSSLPFFSSAYFDPIS